MSEGNAPDRPGVYRSMQAQSMTQGTAVPIGPPSPRLGDPHVEATTTGPEFGDFYRTHWEGVARALSLTLGDRDLAVEATDEAMARAYARWDKLRRYDNPAGWAYRVGLNWSRSYHRRLARRPHLASPGAVDLPPVADPAVREALAALPLGQRSVVVCRLLLDWSVAETATALGLREATVRSRLHRALRSLEASLDHLR
jgi:DNA-directed RNA polymerase specialized sigma24 family protein